MSRGRGRGSSKGISNLEALGIKPGEGIPPPILHPPPLFPPLERRPLELKNNETTQYLLCVKQEFNHFMRQSPFYLMPTVQRGRSITKYSDRYRASTSNDLTELLKNIPNWKNVMPKELYFVKQRIKKKTKSKPVVSGNNQSLSGKHLPQAEIGEQLKQLEEREQVLGESEEEEGGAKTEDEYYDEEIEEEEGDYQQTYFDPGDDFGGDEDDALEDGPSY